MLVQAFTFLKTFVWLSVANTCGLQFCSSTHSCIRSLRTISSGSHSVRLQTHNGDHAGMGYVGPIGTALPRSQLGGRMAPRHGNKTPSRETADGAATTAANRSASTPPTLIRASAPAPSSVTIGPVRDSSPRGVNKTELLAQERAERDARAAAHTSPSAFAVNYPRMMMGQPPIADLPEPAPAPQAPDSEQTFQHPIGPMPGTPRPAQCHWSAQHAQM